MSGPYCSTSRVTCGRGPTIDMSPRSTLISCGSSSREDRRRKRADPRHAGVAAQLELDVVALVEGHQLVVRRGVRHHAAELEQVELLAAHADPAVPVEHRARGW